MPSVRSDRKNGGEAGEYVCTRATGLSMTLIFFPYTKSVVSGAVYALLQRLGLFRHVISGVPPVWSREQRTGSQQIERQLAQRVARNEKQGLDKLAHLHARFALDLRSALISLQPSKANPNPSKTSSS